MRWNLNGGQERTPRHADFAHIAVGTLTDGGWYVDHTGFGTRRFTDKHAAWAAIRRLMSLHEGWWEHVQPHAELDNNPITADGWRLIYSTSGGALYNCWGQLREKMWERYSAAIRKGRRLGDTKRHWSVDGHIYLYRYTDPLARVTRYAIHDMTGGWEYPSKLHVFDHHDYYATKARYAEVVRKAASKGSPFPWSDVPDVPLHVAKNRTYTLLYDGAAEYFGTKPGAWHGWD